MAIERYMKSIKDGEESPLEVGSYVLRINRPPPQQIKVRMKWTGPYKVVRENCAQIFTLIDLV